MSFSGFTAGTTKHLQLDAGAFLKNYDPATDTWDSAKSTKLIGATQGGGSFSAVPTVRKIEVDGVKGNAVGLQHIDEWVVTMVANMKEVSAEVIKLALGSASSSSPAAPTSYTKIVANNDFSDDDYLDNITWVGKISGSEMPVVIVLKKALCLNGLSLTMADKAEGMVTLTFTGHYDTADLDNVPFEIYYPNIV